MTQHATRQRNARLPIWVIAYSALLAAATVFVLLDTFAIERVSSVAQAADTSNIVTAQSASGDQSTESEQGASTSSLASDSSEPVVTDTTYSDENMQISIATERVSDTDVYVVDIQVSSVEYLKTAFAQASYGRNIKDTTSNMAAENDAILAINGDYYGFRDDGFVVRNGVLYRDTASSGTDALVINGDGTMEAVDQSTTTAQQLIDQGAWQVESFGPTLVEDGNVVVDEGDEVGQAMTSNPRTAIGMIEPLHYIVVVSDGRTSQSEGLSLLELAQVFEDHGASFAYNLDGGGSTTLWFNGNVINNPTGGRGAGEREVSDIVYFG